MIESICLLTHVLCSTENMFSVIIIRLLCGCVHIFLLYFPRIARTSFSAYVYMYMYLYVYMYVYVYMHVYRTTTTFWKLFFL